MTEVVIWAQADILKVRTTLVPVSQTSAIETMLLKAIRAGADRKDDLCDVFGLAPRLVEGVLGDLWRAGRISIELNTDREMIKLSSGARKELDELHKDEAVRSSADRRGSEEVAHDRLTGRVLPWQATRRFLRETERGLVVPTMVDDPDPGDLREPDLAEAVTRSLNWKTDAEPGGDSQPPAEEAGRVGDLRIDTVYLEPSLLQLSPERRYVPLRVHAVEDLAGSLSVHVVDDRLPLWVREQAAKRLRGLIAERPTSRFVTQLKQHAQRTLVRTRDLDHMMGELRSLADALPVCDLGNRQREHDRAAGLAGEIDRYTEALALTEMDVKVVTTGEQHHEAIIGLLERAKRQVVMAVPWVRQAGVLDIRDALIAAVGRGVEVTLLWGINSAGAKLPGDALDVLDSIQRHARAAGQGGELRCHRTRGARSHAKIVIADDREMLVTSKNFLSGSELTEVGVLLSAPAGRADEPPLTCPATLEVLKFLYDHVPDPATAFKLIHTREGFGERRDNPDLVPLQLPQLTAAVLDPNAPREHAEAWAAAWQDTARAMIGRAVNSRPTVEVIRDGQHASLARNALEEVGYRVLLASHRVGKQVLTDEVCALVAEREAGKLAVAVRYGEVNDDESVVRLKHLAEGSVNPAAIRRDTRMHAKVVIRDDSTVLGSFNYLSIDAGVRSRRATGELSVKIASASVAGEIWAALAGDVPVRRPAPSVTSGPAGDTGVSGQRLLELLEPTEGLPDVRSLAEFVRAEGTDRVLETLRRLKLGAKARTRVLAAALPVLTEPGPELEQRLADLLPAVWAAGAWACAGVVRDRIGRTALAPSAVLAGALADEAGLVRAIWAAATEEISLTAAEAEAVAVFACVGLLLGDFADADVVSLLRDWSQPPAPRSDPSVSAAVSYLARYGALPTKLPDLAGPVADRVILDRPREALHAALESLRRYDSHSQSGEAVRDRLFAADGEMAALAAALAAGDTAALRGWDKSYSDANDGRWLVKATKAAGQPTIDDHRKLSFIEKHKAIRLALRDLNAAIAADERVERPSDLPPDQTDQLRRLRDLTEALADHLPAESASPEDEALALALARLRARLVGDAAGARPAPGATLDSWALPRVAVLGEETSPAAASRSALLTAVTQDLAAGWSAEQAIMFLLDQGEYGLADAAISRLENDEDLVDAGTLAEIRDQAEMRRRAFTDELDARARTVGLRCDRAALDVDDPRWQGSAEPTRRRAVADARWRVILRELETAEATRRDDLEAALAGVRAELLPDWAQHISDLIGEGEFALAGLALTPEQRNGRGLLPQTVRLAPWSWRSTDLATAAAWFEPGRADVPVQVRTGFLPDPGDEGAVRVIAALQAVAAGTPTAATQWLEAVQSLIVESDEPPVVSEASENGAVGTFMLPYDVRLPRLCWVGQPPGSVTVGEASPHGMLHLSLDLADSQPGAAVVNISDVLGLLGRDPAGRPASMTNRAMRFLGLVASQLPLDHVIAPPDTPAELTSDRRAALAWLLSILGFYLSPAQLDTLRLLGGGHPVPLWHLISAARADPVQGITDLRDRPDLDQILVTGLAADLASDIDLLVLSLVVLMDIRDRPSLAEGLAIAWDDAGQAGLQPDAADLDAAVGRLIDKRYLIDGPDGTFTTCGCAVVRAQRRADLLTQLKELVKQVSATLEVSDLMFRELLSYAVHAEQADAHLRSPEEQRDRARRNTEMQMADRTPFDLGRLCTEEGLRADMVRHDVDVYFDIAADTPLRVNGPEMPYKYLVRELLTNAIKAAADSRDQGSVTLEVRAAADGARAEVTVSDDGPGFPAEFRSAFAARRPVHRPERPDAENVFHRLRMFAESRGSTFELSDHPGGGAVITICLPLLAGPGTEEASA